MIRVLQVVTHMRRGGLETMLMNYYRQIDRTQIQFDFLTHREYEGDYDDEIRKLGGIVYHLPVLNPFSPGYKRTLGAFFDRHPEYQIVHVHQDCLSSVILKVAKQHGVKVRIAHSHGASQIKDIKYPIKLFYRQFIPRYATSLMACGEEAGNWMFQGAEFTVLNNAINAKAYRYQTAVREEQRKKWGIAPGELLAGHVGSFSPPKNHPFLFEVFREIQKKVPAKLILVGRGTLQPEFEKKVAEMGLSDKVIFAGLRSDVPDLLQAMDVFVFPSHYEGLSVALMEAQAAGLPCLISEKVPIECKKTDLVRQLPLSAGAEQWADAAIAAADTPRRDTYAEIRDAGFDIAENAKWLEQIYKEMLTQCV